MITELSLSNFKSWKKIDNMKIEPITGLFGTNSSGKTSILQLLLLIKQTIESTDRSQVLEFGDEKSLTNLGSFHDVIFNHDKQKKIAFTINWKLDKKLEVLSPENDDSYVVSTNSLGFDCEISQDLSGKVNVDRLEYEVNEENKYFLIRKDASGSKYELENKANEFRFIRTQGRPWDLPKPVKFYGFPDQVYAYYKNAGFLSSLQLNFEELFSKVYYLGPLREFPQRYFNWKGSEPSDMGRKGERVVDALLAAKVRGAYISPGPRKRKLILEERVAIWLQKLGLIHSFRVESVAPESNIYQVKVKKNQSSPEVLITDVGFGVSQILPVLVLCYYVPEGSIILLEQPEIHLHPSVQSGLADVFIDAVKNRHIQIIVESHSEHLLRRLQRRMAEEEFDPNKAALYFCESTDVGSKLVRLTVDEFGNIVNWPRSFFGDEFGELSEMTKAIMLRKKKDS